ncbi:MAG: hypothetical protein KY468_20095 [Armatimonadetes bacterium]|nr:hypothetical protein [Armatimonadota bacterium]
MSVRTYEGIVEDGQIKLESGVRLPDRARVFVVVPEEHQAPVPRIVSPRLADPSQMDHFIIEVVEKPSDASV